MFASWRGLLPLTIGLKMAIEQQSIFDVLPAARNSDPETSHQAARRARAGAFTNRTIALAALAHAGSNGLTDFELAEITGIPQTSIGVRRGELVKMGYVIKTEERRPSPSGSPSIVWRAK